MSVGIEVKNVSLSFVRSGRMLLSRNNQMKKKKVFWALKDVSFSAKSGDRIGIVGRNGSGKSTMARLCAGSLFPDHGHIDIRGRVQLLSLGLGFKPELSGMDNIYISASLLGVPYKELTDMVPEIVEFAELTDFIHEPVRTYSSGMKSKLGFAVSTAVRPDILILDETLATGDAAFRKKATERLNGMIEDSGILILVSHSPKQVQDMCHRALWLDHSFMVMDGPAEQVAACYDLFCQKPGYWKRLGRYPEVADL